MLLTLIAIIRQLLYHRHLSDYHAVMEISEQSPRRLINQISSWILSIINEDIT